MIVDVQTGSYFLNDALADVPESTLTVSQLDKTGSVPLQARVEASVSNREAFESGLDDDPTVANYKQVATAGNRETYAVEYADGVHDVEMYDTLVENAGTVLEASTEHGESGWFTRLSVSDREQFHEFEKTCRQGGVAVDIKSVGGEPKNGVSNRYGLSEPQREALVAAAEHGYFSIPRETTLEELSGVLEITRQATAERLRRGYRTLLENTVLTEGTD